MAIGKPDNSGPPNHPEPVDLTADHAPAASVSSPVTDSIAAIEEALDAACLNKDLTAGIQEYIDAGDHTSWRETVSNRLSASTSSEHLHLAALLATDKGTRVDLISRAIQVSPSDPFLTWSAVRLCIENSGNGCPLEKWLARLTINDSENSMAWAQLATHRYGSGEPADALKALRRAAASSTANDYWVETVSLSVDALAAATALSFRERAGFAFGVSAMQFPPFGPLITMCRDESFDPDWAYACLDTGRQLEENSRSVLSSMIGLDLQKLAADSQGDASEVNAIEQRKAATRRDMREAGEMLSDQTLGLIASSPRLFDAYLARIKQDGEIQAAVSFNEDLRLVRKRRPDLVCMTPG